MTFEELLKQQGLSAEQIAAITKGMSENKIYTTSLENVDERYTKLKGQKEDIDKQLETANTTITELKKTGGDAEKLKAKIGEYETTIQKLQGEAITTAKTYALKEQLSKAGVVDPDYLIYKHGGIDKFNFDANNAPIGVEDSIKAYKEDKSMTHLFKQQQQYNPAGGGGSVAKNPFAKETFNLTEQGKLLRENPAQAKEYATAAGVTLNI